VTTIPTPKFWAGEQLESIHVERQRAQAAYDLLDFYNSFSKEDTTRIDALKKEGRDGRRQVATILRRLNVVAREVDLPNVDKVSISARLIKSGLTPLRPGRTSIGTVRSLRKTCYTSSTGATVRAT
jgi:hypothetical protein